MASRTLEMIIKSLQQGKGVTEVTGQLKEGQKSLKDFNKAGAETASGTQASTGAMSNSFSSLTSTILPAIGAATAVVATFKKVMEFSEEGAALERLEDSAYSMARSVGLDMREVVAALRDASLNAISDADLMSTATKAMMLGVGNSANEMAQLMEVATVRGRAMGLSTTQAFNDIVTGIGRGSKLILDNLGIVLNLEQVYTDYAKSLNTTSQALTEQQKKEAMTQAVIKETKGLLEETGGVMEDNMTKLEQYDAASKNFWDNRKKDIGSWAANLKGVFYDFFRILNEGDERTNLFEEAMGKIPEAFLREWPFMKMIANGLNDELGQMSLHIIELQSTFGDGIFTSQKTQAIVDYYIALQDAGTATANLTGLTNPMKTAFDYAKKALAENNVELEKNISLKNALALATGEITTADIQMEGMVNILTQSYLDRNLTTQEYMKGLEALNMDVEEGASMLSNLTTSLNGLPNEIRTRIILEMIGGIPGGSEITIPTDAGTTSGGGGGGNWARAGIGWEVNQDTGEYRAAPWQKGHGGTVEGGQTYIADELRPEVFIAPSDGVVVPIGAAAQQAMNSGVTIILNATIREDADIEKIAVELVRRMR